MSSELKPLIAKWNHFNYLLKRWARRIALKIPPRLIWRFTLFRREKNRITSQLISEPEDSKQSTVETYLFPAINAELLLATSIPRSGVLVESDMYSCYQKTLSNINIPTKNSEFTYSMLDNSSSIISRSDPKSQFYEILILDGNSMYSRNIQNLRNFLENKREIGTKIIVDLPDCYATRNAKEQSIFWRKHSDLIVYHNPFVSIAFNESKSLLWPGFPLPLSEYYFPWKLKSDKVLMQGTSHRERSLYFQAAQSAGLPIINQHHDRVKPTLTHYSYLQYIKAIKSSKYVFTNGYLNSRESIVVGRAFETLATGGVLLYERGSKLSMFYQEYSDFVPVHNISDFIEKMNFLLNNSHISHDIGKRASVRTFCSYNSNIFWKIALSKLGFM
jgi:hypothetical protein